MISSRVSDARQPSLSSFLPARNPGIADERRLVADADRAALLEIDRLLGEDERADALACPADGSVTAVTTKISPTPPWVMKRFAPLST